MPIDKVSPSNQQDPGNTKDRKDEPLLLLALNAEKTVQWSDLSAKVRQGMRSLFYVSNIYSGSRAGRAHGRTRVEASSEASGCTDVSYRPS